MDIKKHTRLNKYNGSRNYTHYISIVRTSEMIGMLTGTHNNVLLYIDEDNGRAFMTESMGDIGDYFNLVLEEYVPTHEVVWLGGK